MSNANYNWIRCKDRMPPASRHRNNNTQHTLTGEKFMTPASECWLEIDFDNI